MMKNFSKKELEHIFANDFQSPVFPILAQKYFSLKVQNFRNFDVRKYFYIKKHVVFCADSISAT